MHISKMYLQTLSHKEKQCLWKMFGLHNVIHTAFRKGLKVLLDYENLQVIGSSHPASMQYVSGAAVPKVKQSIAIYGNTLICMLLFPCYFKHFTQLLYKTI